MHELEGVFYLEQAVILDPTMNTPRDMESDNGSEVVSHSFSKTIVTQKSSNKAEKHHDKKNSKRKPISIGDNEYEKPFSIHEKYSSRPDSLEHISLVQFGIWYESVPKNSKRQRKESESFSDHEIFCPHLETPLYMPKFIQLKDTELGCMYLRERPQIAMFHKFNEEKDAHRFF